MNFLYVKIPVVKRVFDQTHQFEDKVDQILRQDGVGSVAGWGDSLGDVRPDGSRPVAFTRIDVDVSDLGSAIALLKTALPSLGAPSGTQIHYTIDHRHRTDTYLDSAWLLDQTP
jgi:hypothetical protein